MWRTDQGHVLRHCYLGPFFSDGNDLMNDSIDEALFEQTIGSNGK